MKFEALSVLMNRNFSVFVEYYNDFGKKIRRPVGFSGLYYLIGHDWCEYFILRALSDGLDKCIFKLRRGLKIEFRSK